MLLRVWHRATVVEWVVSKKPFGGPGYQQYTTGAPGSTPGARFIFLIFVLSIFAHLSQHARLYGQLLKVCMASTSAMPFLWPFFFNAVCHRSALLLFSAPSLVNAYH